jgi:4-hydroxyphenylpyruvate dioxygenase-like putative hemolysin
MSASTAVEVDQLWHVAIATRETAPKLDRLQADLGIGPWAVLDFEFPSGTASVFGEQVGMRVKAAAGQSGFLMFGFDQPESDPNPFRDLLAKRPSGAHHLACLVKDIGAARRSLRGFGYAEVLASDAVGPLHDSQVSYFDATADLGTHIEVSQVNSELPMMEFHRQGVMPSSVTVQTRGAAYVAIVVPDAERAAANFMRVLGAGVAQVARRQVDGIHHGGSARVVEKIAVVQMGSWVLRLVEPQGAGSPAQEFLTRNGPGIYAFGFLVDDVPGAAAALRARGYRETWSASGFGPHGDGATVHFDTEESLGIAIELCRLPTGAIA